MFLSNESEKSREPHGPCCMVRRTEDDDNVDGCPVLALGSCSDARHSLLGQQARLRLEDLHFERRLPGGVHL